MLNEGKKKKLIPNMVVVLLFFVAVAVNLFVRAGMIKGACDKLLQLGDYTVNKKKMAPTLDRLACSRSAFRGSHDHYKDGY